MSQQYSLSQQAITTHLASIILFQTIFIYYEIVHKVHNKNKRKKYNTEYTAAQ